MTRVIYLAGFGRSGSTLLERILGASPGVFACGELCFFGPRVVSEPGLCGCGRSVEACPIWGRVRDLVTADPDSCAALEEVGLFDRFGSLRAIWSPPGSVPDRRRYAEALGTLYNAIRRVTGAEVLIDSSKYWPYARFLKREVGLKVHLVHMVRDPRGNAVSWDRKVAYEVRDGVQNSMRRHSVPASILRWWLHNGGTARVAPEFDSSLRLRYEDFCDSPRESVRRICETTGISVPQGVFAGDGRLHLGESHQVAGNPQKFQTDVRLRLDERWRRERSPLWQASVYLACAPLLQSLGYRP